MLVEKENVSKAALKRLARQLLSLSETKRTKVLNSLPSDDRMIIVEMLRDLELDKPLLKG